MGDDGVFYSENSQLGGYVVEAEQTAKLFGYPYVGPARGSSESDSDSAFYPDLEGDCGVNLQDDQRSAPAIVSSGRHLKTPQSTPESTVDAEDSEGQPCSPDNFGVFREKEKEVLRQMFKTDGGIRATDCRSSDLERPKATSTADADLMIGDTVYKITDIEHWDDAIKKTHATKYKWRNMFLFQHQEALKRFSPLDPQREALARDFVNAQPTIEDLRNLLFRLNFEPSFIRKFVESNQPLVDTPGVWFVAGVLEYQYNLDDFNQGFEKGFWGPLETDDLYEGLTEFIHAGALSTLHSILEYGLRCSNVGSRVKGKMILGVYGEQSDRYGNSLSNYGTHASIPKCGNDNIVWCVVYRCLGADSVKQKKCEIKHFSPILAKYLFVRYICMALMFITCHIVGKDWRS